MERSRLSPAGYSALLLVGAFALVFVSLFALTVGAADVSVLDVLQNRAPDTMRQILFVIRLPRIAGAILVGACLAISGATLQSVMRNPLADPYILGISSGASVGAAFAVIVGAVAGGAFLA